MQQKKKNSKAYVIAFLVIGVALAGYSLIFPFYRWQHFLIGIGVALLLGRIVFIMAQGLDVSKEAPAQQQQEIPKTGDAAVDSLVEKGQEMLREIRHENELIPDEKLSAQMEQLDDVANRIFHTVAEHPGKAPQIRRFMDYYLPTTLKMLQGYRKMDERQVSGTEADATRSQIRQAMDVVLKAFDKQLDAMYQNDIRPDLLQQRLHRFQDGRSNAGERLSVLHDAKVVIGLDSEGVHDLLEHFLVLSGKADNAVNAIGLFQLVNQRAHLYGLGPCAKYYENFHLLPYFLVTIHALNNPSSLFS